MSIVKKIKKAIGLTTSDKPVENQVKIEKSIDCNQSPCLCKGFSNDLKKLCIHYGKTN